MDFWLLLSLISGACVLIPLMGLFAYKKREFIRKVVILQTRPHLLLKCVVHYPGNKFKVFWRLMPSSGSVRILGKLYSCHSEAFIKDNRDIFLHEGSVVLDGKKYAFKWSHSASKVPPECHWYFNNPSPINFEGKKAIPDVNTDVLTEFQDKAVLKQLMSLGGQKTMMSIMMIGILIIAGILIYIMFTGG